MERLDLLPAVKAGDEDKVAIWIEANIRLIHAVIHSIGIHSGDTYDSCISEGAFGLLRAAKTWNRDLGPFSTYAWVAIRNGIYKAMSAECYEDYEQITDHDVEDIRAQDDFDAVETAMLLDGLMQDLTLHEQLVIASIRAGMTQFEIAAQQGVSQPAIQKTYQRALGRMR